MTTRTAEANDASIADSLRMKGCSDSELAAALWENYSNGYHRLFGFKSVPEYLRERFSGQDIEAEARGNARGFQRLIREYRLAMEIPEFRAAFDLISRSNRRLIAQVITLENAAEWVERGKSMTYRELEALVAKRETPKPDQVTMRRLAFYPGQLEIYERALEVAGTLIMQGGGSAETADAERLEMVCQEFLGTYGTVDGFKSFTVSECPTCGAFAALHRVPEADQVDGQGKVVAFRCAKCEAPVCLIGAGA